MFPIERFGVEESSSSASSGKRKAILDGIKKRIALEPEEFKEQRKRPRLETAEKESEDAKFSPKAQITFHSGPTRKRLALKKAGFVRTTPLSRILKSPIVKVSSSKNVLLEACTTNESGKPLNARVAENLKNMGIDSLYEYQLHVLRVMMTTRSDIVLQSPTGTGKTLAFVIPILESLVSRVVSRTRALIVSPTRELATQTYDVLMNVSRGLDLGITLAVGKSKISRDTRNDIVVVTPGRFAGLIKGDTPLDLRYLQFLVIDEADRLLAQRYQDWQDIILSESSRSTHGSFRVDINGEASLQFSRKRENLSDELPLRKLIVSATIPGNPRDIHSLHLTRPLLIVTGESGLRMPSQLKHFYVDVELETKPLVLIRLCTHHLAHEQLLVFAKSAQVAHRVFRMLELFGSTETAEIHGTLEQAERTRILKEFNQGKIRTLVASDIATRGLDVEGIGAVLNYDVPSRPKTYLHRAGRTARAGKEGQSYTLVTTEEMFHFKRNMSSIEDIDVFEFRVDLGGQEFDEKYQKCLSQLQKTVESEKHGAHATQRK